MSDTDLYFILILDLGLVLLTLFGLIIKECLISKTFSLITLLPKLEDGPKWDFNKSIGSNIAVFGAIVTSLLSVMPKDPRDLTIYLATKGFIGLSLLFALLVIIAPLVFSVLQPNRIDTKTRILQSHVSVWGVLSATGITLLGSYGQLLLLITLTNKLGDITTSSSNSNNNTPVILFTSQNAAYILMGCLIISLILLVIYSLFKLREILLLGSASIKSSENFSMGIPSTSSSIFKENSNWHLL